MPPCTTFAQIGVAKFAHPETLQNATAVRTKQRLATHSEKPGSKENPAHQGTEDHTDEICALVCERANGQQICLSFI